MQPSALTVGKLMGCFDMCTSEQMNSTFGRGTADSDYTFLEMYRTTFSETRVLRVFVCSARSFRIDDAEALSYLKDHNLVFMPLIEPDTVRHDLLPPDVTRKIYLKVYSHLLYFLWQHLRTFKGAKEVKTAAVISFQNTPELAECRDTFSRICAPFKDANGKQLLAPIKERLLHELELKFSVRAIDS